ncbi:MAG: HlyD family efflux transporter periplasmic adaptor subunit [Rubritepida sp.]|nr:HlyD family efflux transporter periplasmic adaptor subunit [Rubritepida sp.]
MDVALPPAATSAERAWLERLARMLGARAGLVVLCGAARLEPVAIWPGAASVEPLVAVTERVAAEGEGLFAALGERLWAVGYPLRDGAGALRAVVALAVPANDEEALTRVLRQLEWGAAGLALLLERREAEAVRGRLSRLAEGVATLAATLSPGRFDAAALAFVTELANRFAAERVSYAIVRRGGARLAAISHSAQFGRKMNLARLIERAMDEALDQRAAVVLPAPEDAALVRTAARELAPHGALAVLPLFLDAQPIAALAIERAQPFGAEELAELESLGALAAAALADKWRQDRPWPVKLGLMLRDGAARLVGRGHVEWKLATLAAAALTAFLALAEGTYRLPADATLVSRSQQFVAAPFAGFIRTAPARAGDRVGEGALLVALDDRDLQLERLRLRGEIARVEAQAQRAGAERDRARVAILAAEREQHQAQLALVEQQLDRTRLAAPFEGLVVSGDLSQRLGGAVEKGEVLFAVAPTDEYRVDLQVRESRVGDVREGQRGTLFLSARPDQGLPFTITRITPRVVAEDGRSFFIVEAHLDALPAGGLQPGLQGVGKIEIGPAGLFTIWTRDIREWLRLQWWWFWA